MQGFAHADGGGGGGGVGSGHGGCLGGEGGGENGGNGRDGGSITVQHPSQLQPMSASTSQEGSKAAISKQVDPAHELVHASGSIGEGDGGGAGGGEGAGVMQTEEDRSALFTPGTPRASSNRSRKVTSVLVGSPSS